VKLDDALKYRKYANADHARKFAQHMVPHVVRPAQIIWNKALGAVFGFLAFSGFTYAFKHSDNPAALALAAFFGAVMAFFCVTSFLRAWRLSRSGLNRI
jgi:hypothetical protein